ncbi:hypothetical protein CYLTODRAFT_457110 [Cylindrobasidium torrendii FP15055 ss-10]|uniref:Uncharacterized protein n=1 Tax=Cylindrobasidium torrendii FP15055 ss-10 TaxID=1314674 RepID=A0A0D7B236_9AGAR|nr:hypothetical protein CYLTODRAFT_457110 [Cylindrobasidium torrendii FP15055 ss-10]
MATEEGGWDDFWPKDKAERRDWRDVLSLDERPILGYVPENFLYPERYDDDLDLNNFDPSNPPRFTTSDRYESTSKSTPTKLRTPDNYNERTKWEGSHKGALVMEIAIYGDKDLLTGEDGPQQVCHANAVAISAEEGWVIDLLRGVLPGISWPDVCPIRLAPKGWWFYAFPIQYRNGPNIRVFNPDTGEEIPPTPGQS